MNHQKALLFLYPFATFCLHLLCWKIRF